MPHIICHMASSLDGRILPKRWSPAHAHSPSTYEDLHARLGGGSWIVGRATGQEFAKRDAYPDHTELEFPREPWLPETDAAAYGIVFDPHGKIAWGRSEVGGDPIIVILAEEVPDAHLAGLREDGVGYVFAGKTEINLHHALAILDSELGLTSLLLEGGGHLNGAFLRAGLVNEISFMLVPAIDGSAGAPAVFDGPDSSEPNLPPVDDLMLEHHEVLGGGIVWLRYQVRDGRPTPQPTS